MLSQKTTRRAAAGRQGHIRRRLSDTLFGCSRPLVILCVLGVLGLPLEQVECAEFSMSSDASAHQMVSGCALPPDRLLKLADALNCALCNNPSAAKGWERIRGQQADLYVARSAYLPTVNLTTTDQWGHDVTKAESDIPVFNSDVTYVTPVATADLNLVLFDFGLRSHKVQSASEQLIAGKALQEDTLQTIVVNTAQAYFDVENAQAALASTQEAEKTAAVTLKASMARLAEGTAVRVDVLQAQTSLSQAIVKRVSAEGDLASKMGALATAMGLRVDVPLKVDGEETGLGDPTSAESMDQLLKEAELHNPKIQAARAQALSAEEDVGTAQAQGRPTISMEATYRLSRVTYDAASVHAVNQIPANTYDRNGTVMLKVSIPLFEGFARTFGVRSARAKADGALADLQAAIQQAMLDVWSADQSLHSALRDVGASEDLLRSATESLEATQGRYAAGVGSILDVLNAQSAIEDARKSRIQSYSTWHIAKLKLAVAVGNISLTELQ